MLKINKFTLNFKKINKKYFNDGEKMKIICQSCAMPLEKESDFGTDKNGKINKNYCKYCYTKGEFSVNCTMQEFIEMCSQFGEQAGMTNEQMKAYCEAVFPKLKRWGNNKGK